MNNAKAKLRHFIINQTNVYFQKGGTITVLPAEAQCKRWTEGELWRHWNDAAFGADNPTREELQKWELVA